MFSINDTIDTGEPIEVEIKNYAEVDHTHQITDVVDLEERLKELEQKIESILKSTKISDE